MHPSKKESPYREYENLAYHPYNILLVLVLMALGAIFLALSVAFVYNRVAGGLPPVRMPGLFFFNTLLLLGSSLTMWLARKAFEDDRSGPYLSYLSGTLFLSLAFLVLQFFAWRSLFAQNVFINTDNSASYLYLLSGLHFLHVVGGLPFLVWFWRSARRRLREPVSELVYFSDPDKRLKLRLLTLYWHFLDGLWVYLVLFFWVNRML